MYENVVHLYNMLYHLTGSRDLHPRILVLLNAVTLPYGKSKGHGVKFLRLAR